MKFKSGDIDNAFRSAIIAIKDESLEAEEQAELNYIIGTKYLQEGNLDQSIKLLSSAVKQNSVEKKYYLKLAEVYADRREISNALSVLNQAINIFPEEATLYYQAGLIHKEQKEYPIAEEFLLKAIQLAPNDMHIRRLHGSVVVLNLIHNRKLARLDTG
jgi:tetratricopeptide (TPR) repeat protein